MPGPPCKLAVQLATHGHLSLGGSRATLAGVCGDSQDGDPKSRYFSRNTEGDIKSQRRFFVGQIAQCDKERRKWEQAYLADTIDVQDLKTKKPR